MTQRSTSGELVCLGPLRSPAPLPYIAMGLRASGRVFESYRGLLTCKNKVQAQNVVTVKAIDSS